jgi:2-iminobutanoate/2-iminopropanoate deaminase
LTDLNDFKVVNAIYEANFTSSFPARSAFPVAALPLAGKIEVEAVINIKTMS